MLPMCVITVNWKKVFWHKWMLMRAQKAQSSINKTEKLLDRFCCVQKWFVCFFSRKSFQNHCSVWHRWTKLEKSPSQCILLSSIDQNISFYYWVIFSLTLPSHCTIACCFNIVKNYLLFHLPFFCISYGVIVVILPLLMSGFWVLSSGFWVVPLDIIFWVDTFFYCHKKFIMNSLFSWFPAVFVNREARNCDFAVLLL